MICKLGNKIRGNNETIPSGNALFVHKVTSNAITPISFACEKLKKNVESVKKK